MAFGKESGQFSVKLTSQTFGPGTGKGGTLQANMEGTASGELGEGHLALTYYTEGELGATVGTWQMHGLITLTDETLLGFQSQGTWQEIGKNKWRYQGTGQNSNGSTYATEFEGDWATKTWTGKVYTHA